VYQEEYKRKLVSAEEAVKVVKSGDIVDYGFFNGKPVACDIALAARKDELQDVQIFSAVTIPPVPEVAKLREHFTYVDWQFSKVSRILQSNYDLFNQIIAKIRMSNRYQFFSSLPGWLGSQTHCSILSNNIIHHLSWNSSNRSW
jgi:acyl-CoA hydrolase